MQPRGRETHLQPSRPSFLARSLNDARRDGATCDAVLRVDGKDFPAHKLVLSTASPVFRAMFTAAFTEAASGSVVIEGVSCDVWEAFLLFVYTEELANRPPGRRAELLDLLQLADRYMVDVLKDRCRDMLLYDMDAATALEVLSQDKACLDSALRRKAAWQLIKQRKALTDDQWRPFQVRRPELADVVTLANEELDCTACACPKCRPSPVTSAKASRKTVPTGRYM